MTQEALQSSETRSAGWDLATRIRFLREEIKRGVSSLDLTEELVQKEQGLVHLFQDQLGTNVAQLQLTVQDTAESDNTSGWVFCQRMVIVDNPLASSEATGIVSISLLTQGVNPNNLIEAQPSEPLPPAYRS